MRHVSTKASRERQHRLFNCFLTEGKNRAPRSPGRVIISRRVLTPGISRQEDNGEHGLLAYETHNSTRMA